MGGAARSAAIYMFGGFIGGIAVGFGVAERVYASEGQKQSLRFAAKVATVAIILSVAATAVLPAVRRA